MRSNAIEKRKDALSLSKAQRAILVGTLLGDGHLETSNGGQTFRLKVEHSVKQRAYVEWLHHQFKEWVNTPPKSKRKQIGLAKYENYYFQTLSCAQLRFYGAQFYDKQGHKRVPRQIKRWLTPLALAVWFMDDGSIKSQYHRALILNTQCFSRQELRLLQQALQANFAIEARVRKQKDGLQLLIVGQSAKQMVAVMRPYVLPEFTYKFGLLA